MAQLGNAAVHLILILATWAGVLALVGARRRSATMVHAATLMTYATAAVASVAMVTLAYAFAISDLNLVYVQQHSDHAMPLFYRITSLWGGMEGSLLLWAWLLAVFTALAIRSNRERLRELTPWAIVVLMVVIDFFAVLLIVHSNPFEVFLTGAPTTGKGLNPLLQNPYMVTHPPSLYLGFVGMAIPFAFAMAALITGHTDEAWLQAVRRWALLAWFFLALGLTLGMLWAYEELGWGGYWGWDPVENAGFMPWLLSTAFIHSIIVQERRQMLKTWNMVLAILAFCMTIFGTFLTRSGFIDSVHAFARSNIGYVFLAFIGIVLVVGLGLVVWRLPKLRSRGELESVMSREFWFLLNNWVLLSGCLLVMVLTVFPNISEAFGEKITISIPAFNRWMTPVGLALLVITGIGPMLGWRSTDGEGLKRQFLWPLSAGLLTMGLLLAVFGRHRGLPAGTWALCVFVLATIVQEVIRASRIRAKAVGSSALSAVPGLIGRNRRRYGGYIVHLGIVLMCVGFAGDSFKVEREVVMRPGQRVDIGAYSLRFDGIESGADEAKQMLTATLSVYASGKHLGQIQPARWTFFKHEDQPTTEVALRRTLKEDLFVAIGDHDPQAGTTGFKAIINPLVNWVWIGFLVLALGTAIAALPIGAPVATAAGTTALLLLLLGWPALARADATHGMGGNNPAHEVPTDKPVILDSDSERSVMKNFACLCGGCPKIPLDSCPCGFAQTERAAIRGKIAEGWDLERIIGWYTTARGPEIGKKPFGAVALAIPPDTAFNRLSWLVPYGASAVAAGVLFALGRRWARRRRAADETQTPAEAAAASSSDKAYEELLKRELKDLE